MDLSLLAENSRAESSAIASSLIDNSSSADIVITTDGITSSSSLQNKSNSNNRNLEESMANNIFAAKSKKAYVASINAFIKYLSEKYPDCLCELNLDPNEERNGNFRKYLLSSNSSNNDVEKTKKNKSKKDALNLSNRNVVLEKITIEILEGYLSSLKYKSDNSSNASSRKKKQSSIVGIVDDENIIDGIGGNDANNNDDELRLKSFSSIERFVNAYKSLWKGLCGDNKLPEQQDKYFKDYLKGYKKKEFY